MPPITADAYLLRCLSVVSKEFGLLLKVNIKPSNPQGKRLKKNKAKNVASVYSSVKTNNSKNKNGSK